MLAGLNAAPEFLDLFLARNRFLPSRGPSRTFGSFEGPVCQRRQIKKCNIRKIQQTPLCPRILCRTPIFWGCPFAVIFSSNIPWNFYVQGWKMTPQAYVFMGQIQLAENDFAIFRFFSVFSPAKHRPELRIGHHADLELPDKFFGASESQRAEKIVKTKFFKTFAKIFARVRTELPTCC